MSIEIRSAIDFYDRHPISSEIILAKLSASRGHLKGVSPEELFLVNPDACYEKAETDLLKNTLKKSYTECFRIQPAD